MSVGYRKLYTNSLLIFSWLVFSLIGINCVKMTMFEVKCGHPEHEGKDTPLQFLGTTCTEKSLRAWYEKHRGRACYGYLCGYCP